MQGKLLNKGLSRQEYMLLVMRCMHDHVTESRDQMLLRYFFQDLYKKGAPV